MSKNGTNVIIIGLMFICISSMFILFMYADFLLTSSIFCWSFDLDADILSFCQAFTSFIILFNLLWSTILRLIAAVNKLSKIAIPTMPSADSAIPFIHGLSEPVAVWLKPGIWRKIVFKNARTA